MVSNHKSAILGAAAFALVAAVSANAASDTIRVNSGGPEYIDSKGRKWAADSGYTGGQTYEDFGVDIAGTDDPALHQDERWEEGEFSYNFDVNPGTYTVKLYEATLWDGACGEGTRLFNVTINGTQVLNDWDMSAEVDCLTAIIKSFKVEAPNGKITIVFSQGSIQNPKINAIEIVPWDPSSIKSAAKVGMGRFSVASSNGGLLVRSQAEGAYTLELKDLQGRLIERKSGFDAGSHSFSNLRPGLYLLTSVSGNETVTRKVNVLR